MKRVVADHEAVEDILFLQINGKCIEHITIAGKCHRGRAVDRGQEDPAGKRRDQVLRIRLCEADRQHAASRGDTPHGPGPATDDARGLPEIEDSRRMRGGDLPDAVSHHRCRRHAPRSPKRGERNLQSEDQRLCDRGLPQSRTRLCGREFGEQGPSGEFAHEGVTLHNLLPKNRLLIEKLAPHRPPLRSLTAEDEGNLALVRRQG